jgi:transposase
MPQQLRKTIFSGVQRKAAQIKSASFSRSPSSVTMTISPRAIASIAAVTECDPDLNPIEQAFAKLKAALRQAAARTFDTVIKAIAQALADFPPQECTNYIANSVYSRQS